MIQLEDKNAMWINCVGICHNTKERAIKYFEDTYKQNHNFVYEEKVGDATWYKAIKTGDVLVGGHEEICKALKNFMKGEQKQ